VLVVMQVYHAPVRQFGESLDCAVVGIALKFDRADETAAGAGFKPSFHQLQQSVWVAGNITDQPIDPAKLAGVDPKGAVLAEVDTGEMCDAWIERCFVDTDYCCSETLQDPGPTTGATAEVETDIAFARAFVEQSERLPEFQVGAVWRLNPVLFEADFAIWKPTGALWRGQDGVLIQESPGAQRCTNCGFGKPQRPGRDMRQLFDE